MSTPLLGDVLFLISLFATACLVVFMILSLWSTLHRRRLTIWELMLYIAGAGVALALPQCFYWKIKQHYDMIGIWHEVRWVSLCLTWLALVPVVYLINRSSRQ
jgi:hypothetical protein